MVLLVIFELSALELGGGGFTVSTIDQLLLIGIQLTGLLAL